MKFLSFILAAVMSISVFAGGLFLKSTQKKEADSNRQGTPDVALIELYDIIFN